MTTTTADQRVAANVRAEMGRRSISQSKLAKHLGGTQQALSRRLTGHISFSIAELEAIAQALDIPLSDLTDAKRTTA